MAIGDGAGNQGIVNALIQLAQVLNGLLVAFKSAFPQAGSTVSHTATAGADTLPANPAGFITITIGTSAFKVPIYNP